MNLLDLTGLGEAWRIAKIAFVVALFPAGVVTGCMDEKERFDAYKAVVAAIGNAQEKRTADRIASDRATKERVDRDYQDRLDRLERDRSAIAAQLLEHASRSLLPAVPTPTASGGAVEVNSEVVCFARDRLSQGLSEGVRRFAGRFETGIHRGAAAITDFESCAGWALEEAAKPR